MEKDIQTLLDLNSRGIISDEILLESIKKLQTPKTEEEKREELIKENRKKAKETREKIAKIEREIDRDIEINNNIKYLKGLKRYNEFEGKEVPKYTDEVLDTLTGFELDNLVASEKKHEEEKNKDEVDEMEVAKLKSDEIEATKEEDKAIEKEEKPEEKKEEESASATTDPKSDEVEEKKGKSIFGSEEKKHRCTKIKNGLKTAKTAILYGIACVAALGAICGATSLGLSILKNPTGGLAAAFALTAKKK